MKVLFLNMDRSVVESYWDKYQCGVFGHILLPVHLIRSAYETLVFIQEQAPDVIIIPDSQERIGGIYTEDLLMAIIEDGYTGHFLNRGEQYPGSLLEGRLQKNLSNLRPLLNNLECLDMVKGRRFKEVCSFIRDIFDPDEIESLAHTILEETPDNDSYLAVCEVLEKFLQTRKHSQPEHGEWVARLSRLSIHLWNHRLVDWIQNCNAVAFLGAEEVGDYAYLDHLVSDFAFFSEWCDDPSGFHIELPFLENKMTLWRDCPYVEERIRAGVFSSQEEFDRWEEMEDSKLYSSQEPHQGKIALDRITQRNDELRSVIAEKLGYAIQSFQESEKADVAPVACLNTFRQERAMKKIMAGVIAAKKSHRQIMESHTILHDVHEALHHQQVG